MKAITTSLGFKNEAEDAAKFYVNAFSSVFGNKNGDSKILATTHFGAEELAALSYVPEDIRPGPAGSVSTVRFQLIGQEFTAFNGGNYFGKFHESMSIYVSCRTQEEIDRLWGIFAEGAKEIQSCGWIKDKYGVSWQIAPTVLQKMAEDPDRQKAERVMIALYGMKKIDIEGLKRAYEGRQ
jgi:predicted 3-demethylubiquinone-9 3-methyltransferase (glyoxalase superfamily)